jgi:hypothetical protein
MQEELTVTVTPHALELAADTAGTFQADVLGGDAPVAYNWVLPNSLAPISPVNDPIVAFTTHGPVHDEQTSITLDVKDVNGHTAQAVAHVTIRSVRA